MKQGCDWVNMMEVCLNGKWVCARAGPCRFPGKILNWTIVGRCSGFFGWKFLDVPWLGDLDGPVVGKWNVKGLGV